MSGAEVLDLRPLEEIIAGWVDDGRAALLPVLLDAQRRYGYLSEPVVLAISEALRVPAAEIHGVIEFYSMLYREPVGTTLVRVCTSPSCAGVGGKEVLAALCHQLGVKPGERTADGRYSVEEVPCLCLCDFSPSALVGDVPVGHVSASDPLAWVQSPQPAPLGLIGGDKRWKTARCGEIAPTDLEAYERTAGWSGLRRALLELSPAQVIEEVKASGLVGRGGAAFPTGLKWQYSAQAAGEERFVVCNGDESEPGTFKDRVLLEGDPFQVLEGMIIAGYAIGAHKGYVYIRGEFPRARSIMAEAIDRARQAGWLGEAILGTDFSFQVELRSGAGAYICGEETALFESIEGKRGFPRLKPPYPTTHGLFGKPTAINNVETLCDAAWILAHGVEAYRAVGTEDSPGTKLFCLSGDVERPGVYETPFGLSLQALVDMAGGVKGELQALLIGGAAGTFASPRELHLEMSFEGLREGGHALGSGVVMVMNTNRDMGQTLLSIAEFFAHESCGKCYPCRLGTQRQLEIMQSVVQGRASRGDLVALEDIEFAMRETSICGLGVAAGTALISAYQRWPGVFGRAEAQG